MGDYAQKQHDFPPEVCDFIRTNLRWLEKKISSKFLALKIWKIDPGALYACVSLNFIVKQSKFFELPGETSSSKNDAVRK